MIFDERTAELREAIIQNGLSHVGDKSHHIKNVVLCDKLDSNWVVRLAELPQALA